MSKFRKDNLKYSLSNMFTLPSKRMVSYQTKLSRLLKSKDTLPDTYVAGKRIQLNI